MFDPNTPADHAELTGVMFRDKFNSLKAVIDAILTVTAAQVDSTATLPPDYPAGVSVNVIGNTLHFSFDIPRGADGLLGPVGPPFAQALVDAVNTLPPGMPAAVNVIFDGTNVHFSFDIPRGADGIPGEVTNADLGNAISGTSSNTNAVATLDTPYGDPVAEELRQKLNEFILAGRRL